MWWQGEVLPPETSVPLQSELRSPAESEGDVRALRKETQENCALGMETGKLLREPRWCSRERDLLTAWIRKQN